MKAGKQNSISQTVVLKIKCEGNLPILYNMEEEQRVVAIDERVVVWMVGVLSWQGLYWSSQDKIVKPFLAKSPINIWMTSHGQDEPPVVK